MTYQLPNVIAIDGPAASGKTTIGKMLADKLGYLFLDTGSMYRAVTLAVLRANIDVLDETAVTHIAETLDLTIEPAHHQPDKRLYTVKIGPEDVTWQLRTPPVDANVSQISKYIGVRQEMVARQQAYGKKGCVVMVGRDIGTIVMPEAPLKLFITASAAERARRRWNDRQRLGHQQSFESILADVERRDQIDSSRTYSPLIPAEDAIKIDTTSYTAVEIVNKILNLIQT